MNSNEINYHEKIRNFQIMTDNNNEQIALDYLTRNHWDESQAAQMYFNELHSHNFMEQPHYIEEIKENNNVRNRNNNYQPISQVEDQQRLDQNNNPGFFSNYVVRPLKWVGSFFCSRDTSDTLQSYNSIFSDLPEIVDNMQSFSNGIRAKIGLIILYRENDNSYFEQLIKSLKEQEYILDILRVNYIIYPLLINSSEGKRIISILPDRLLYPSFIFAHNKRNNSFTRSSVLDKLEGNLSVDVLRDALIKNIELKERVGNSKNSATAEIINQQKEELEYLEKMEEERKKEEEMRIKKDKENKIRAEREELERKRLEEEKLKFKKEKEKFVCKEPDANDPNSTLIIFRYPDGNKRTERRFLKSDKVKSLYDFVDSLGSEIFLESDKYELIQPFPPTCYNNLEKTLEEEKLINAVLQIREI